MLDLPRIPVPGSHALRVLIADDEPTLQVAVRGLIGLMGHAADAVPGGLEALEAANSNDYDVVILDVQMPGKGGMEAARRLRGRVSQPGGQRIVGMSCEPEDPATYIASGMDDFLAKPILRADLLRVLAPACP